MGMECQISSKGVEEDEERGEDAVEEGGALEESAVGG